MHNILITGASRGLGAQLARSYAKPGVHLILVARNTEELKSVADTCEERGAHTLCATIDVRDAVNMKNFILDVDATYPIDLVIANAGVSSTLRINWQQEPAEALDAVFSTNMQGTLNTINPLIPNMIQRKNGQLVLMSSLAALRGLPQSPSYSASKAALRIYGQSLRSWLARYHIQVNVVCPGYIDTDMSKRLHGPKPFLVSCEKAVKIIRRGLIQNKACIAFPWQLSWLTKLAVLLPTKPVDFILNKYESYVE